MSSSVEMRQIKLRLTNDKRVLAALRRRKRLTSDDEGEKLVMQFDSKEFVFRPGVAVTIGASVGKCLLLDSLVINGENDLTDPLTPALVSLGTFNVGEKSPDEHVSQTVCPVCNKEQHTLGKLADHIRDEHARPKKAVEVTEAAGEAGGEINEDGE